MCGFFVCFLSIPFKDTVNSYNVNGTASVSPACDRDPVWQRRRGKKYCCCPTCACSESKRQKGNQYIYICLVYFINIYIYNTVTVMAVYTNYKDIQYNTIILY